MSDLLAKRQEVLRLFKSEESWRVSSTLPFLLAWGATGRAMNNDLGEYAAYIWLCLGFAAGLLSQIESKFVWRGWVYIWGITAIAIMETHHEWFKLAIAGWSCAVGCLLLAQSQELRARALSLANQYDLLNSNGAGSVGDVRSIEDIRDSLEDSRLK